MHLADADAIFDKMISALTNPVQEHLVDKVFNWPGVSSLSYQLRDKPMVAKRPKWFLTRPATCPRRWSFIT